MISSRDQEQACPLAVHGCLISVHRQGSIDCIQRPWIARYTGPDSRLTQPEKRQ